VDVVGRVGRYVHGFGIGELGPPDRQCVVAAGIEVVELVDPVEYVTDELLQEDPRCDASTTAEITGDCTRQICDLRVIGDRADAVLVFGATRIDVDRPVP